MKLRVRSHLLVLAVAACLPLACASRGSGSAPDAEVYRRAEAGRSKSLEGEVERLRADLRLAEQAMVAIESGQRGNHTRANAVSAIAEARIAVERAARKVAWRAEQIEDAEKKLAVADRQLRSGNFGSAVFFASRAHRVADSLSREAAQVSRAGNVSFVRARRLNLRSEPSKQGSVLGKLAQGTPVFSERTEGEWTLVRTSKGQVGWVFASLLREG